MDEIKLVESDDEIQYKPIQQKQNQTPKTIQEKREQFRMQIRKQKIDEQLEKKRMWFHPKQNNEKSFIAKNQLTFSISTIFNDFKQAYASKNQDFIRETLHSISFVIDDRNRIHSLFLTQRNFLQFYDLLKDETFYFDTFTIYLQLTQDDEFYSLPINDIEYTINRSLDLLIENTIQDELLNIILGYMANIASKLKNIQYLLLQKQSIQLLNKIMKDTLIHNICYFIQTIFTKIPDDFKYQLTIALRYLKYPIQQELLQTLYIINKQCTTYDPQVDYQSILKLLFHYVFEFLENELDFESFYSALVQLKFLSDFQPLINLFLSINVKQDNIINDKNINIFDTITKLINYKYQKIRTAGLFILQNICKSNHFVIKQIFEQKELLIKLINILTMDKPINQSLVLKAIIHILQYGNEQDCAILMDLGLAVHLKLALESQEATIVIQGLECVIYLMNYGNQLENMNIPNPILQKLMQNHVINQIELLQYSPNKEVFIQAQKVINLFFRVE